MTTETQTPIFDELAPVFSIAADAVPPKGARRHPDWDTFRDEQIALHPYCAICGATEELQLHHKIPFAWGGGELDPDNVVVLCAHTFNCHLLFGHLGDFKSINPHIDADIAEWTLRRTLRKPLTRVLRRELEVLRASQVIDAFRKGQTP